MKVLSCFVFVLLHSGISSAKPTDDVVETGKEGSVLSSVVETVNNCLHKELSLCLKETALQYGRTLNARPEVVIADGLSIQHIGSPRMGKYLESLPAEPRAREAQINSRLFDLAVDFLKNRTLKLKLPSGLQRSLEEGRQKKNPLKKLLPLLVFLRLKMNALIPILLALLAFISVKALIIGKLAFIISAIGMFKNLLTTKKPMIPIPTTYEVVSEAYNHDRPYPPSNTPNWGRTYEDGDKLAYSNYASNQE